MSNGRGEAQQHLQHLGVLAQRRHRGGGRRRGVLRRDHQQVDILEERCDAPAKGRAPRSGSSGQVEPGQAAPLLDEAAQRRAVLVGLRAGYVASWATAVSTAQSGSQSFTTCPATGTSTRGCRRRGPTARAIASSTDLDHVLVDAGRVEGAIDADRDAADARAAAGEIVRAPGPAGPSDRWGRRRRSRPGRAAASAALRVIGPI